MTKTGFIQANLGAMLRPLQGYLRWFLFAILLALSSPALASDIVGARPSQPSRLMNDSSSPAFEAISKVSQYCGVKFLKKYLPETLKKHTLCGAAVTEMVQCVSQHLHPGKTCNANCGHGRMFTEPGCIAKMKACGYKPADPHSDECKGPGAVTAFEHSPTPRGQLYGHVQFGCGGVGQDSRFCSSYKRPIEHSWPPGQTPGKCFVPDEVLLSARSLASLSVPTTPEVPALPEFNYDDPKHALPPSDKCPTCGSFAEKLKHYREQKEAFEALVAANNIAQELRASSVKYGRTPEVDKENEMRSAIIAATAIQNDDFDAAAIHHLLSFCAQDQARFYGVFWQMPEADQKYISSNLKLLKLAQRARGNGSNCIVPDVRAPID